MSGTIRFFTENINLRISRKQILREWFVHTVTREGGKTGQINIILTDDAFLSELNQTYLRHTTLTDILTFPAEGKVGVVCGDIYISYPRVVENAAKYKQSIDDELHRVMIHGILHLLGFKDGTPEEKLLMRSKEDQYLDWFKSHRTSLKLPHLGPP